MTIQRYLISTAMLAACFAAQSFAAVTPDEAAKLKTTLTPLGGLKAASADGAIPEWTGAVAAQGGRKLGDIPVELFGNEKPILQISAKNLAQHAGRLNEGTQALMKKYPDSFKINVYPTHRTATTPASVVENTFKNATRCNLKDAGHSVTGCYGGIPFPIPKSGLEVVWNWLLRVEGESVELGFKNIVGVSDGSRSLATRNDESFQFPYYYGDGSPDKWNGDYVLVRFNTTAPPFKVGETLVLRDNVELEKSRGAWQYLVGQRRVRRAPTVAYDTPDFVASGANYFDEVKGYMGHPDRFEWKIVGKREMYVPYNTNEFHGEKADAAFVKNHLNPDKLRWELHRVWEVEATVASGKRHAVHKRKFYFDEDSWILVLMDGYDGEGKLWRTVQGLPFFVPKIPALVTVPAVVFNLQAGTMSGVQMLNEEFYRVVPRKSDNYFTGESIASGSAR
jgi:hypothetical protein